MDQSKSLPHDWRQVYLRDICSEPLRYGINAAAVHHSDQLPTYIRITDITADGRLDPTSKVSVDDHAASAYLVDEDDILLARTGASVGKSYRHRQLGNESCVYAGFLIRAKIDQTKAIPAYIAATLNTGEYWEWVAVTSQRSGQPGINGQEYGAFEFALPPISEQQAIAEVLSHMDDLIEAQEALIEKKRAIKQGVMQELLTGRRRLPGFEGEWEQRRIKEVVRIRRDKLDPRTNRAPLLCLEMENLESNQGRINGFTELNENSSIKSIYKKGDVLFGKLRAYLRKYWHADRGGICSTEIWPLSPEKSFLVSEYLFQFVQTEKFIEAASNSFGTHMPRSDWKIVGELIFQLPGVQEQQAISNILSEMDREINVLSEQLFKLRILKGGMAQELLTGRIRLV